MASRRSHSSTWTPTTRLSALKWLSPVSDTLYKCSAANVASKDQGHHFQDPTCLDWLDDVEHVHAGEVLGKWPYTCWNPEPSYAHAAQVVIGKDNQAFQGTSQSATNSITNENVAGRRLLGSEQKGSCKDPLLLFSAWLRLSLHQSTDWWPVL